MKLVTARQMQEIDRRTIDGGLVPSLQLMENAGQSVAREVRGLLTNRARVEVLCGKGNNAGDGFVVARALSQLGVDVCVHLTHPPTQLSPDARTNHERLRQTSVQENLIPGEIPDPGPVDDPARRPGSSERPDFAAPSAAAPAGTAPDEDGLVALERHLRQADLCVDALLGTGVERPLRGRLAALINLLNHHSARTLAVDVPSGVDGSTGEIRGTAVWADHTVTFGLPKIGLVLHPGRERTGRLVVADIGFPDSVLADVPEDWIWVDSGLAGSLLAPVEPTAHKYARGCVLVVAGSRTYPGAAALAAEAALRSGAGIVHLVAPQSIRDVLEGRLTEVIVHPAPESDAGGSTARIRKVLEPLIERADALAIGPGLGGSDETTSWVRELLATLVLPAVVDADGLFGMPAPPHPGGR
ncbi:MAG: NAD(P)H-hydrate epimerase, partial [Candidatus Krumholzibacteriia bacterium]